MKQETVKCQLDFILNAFNKGNGEYFSSEIRRLYFRAWCNTLKKITGVHFSHNDTTLNNYHIASFFFYENELLMTTPEVIADKFKAFIETKLGWAEFVEYTANFAYFFNDGGISITDKIGQYKSSAHNSGLLHFLKFLTSGVIDADLAEVNKLEHNGKSLTMGNPIIDGYQMGNITIKQFQNGRCDLKGITQEQHDKLKRMHEIHDIVRHMRYQRKN